MTRRGGSGSQFRYCGVSAHCEILILVSAAAANRDPDRFADPDRFDITRNSTGHLSFGRGEHRCLGPRLGRLEVQIALTALLGRFPGIRLAETPASWRTGMFMRRLDTLPVVLAR